MSCSSITRAITVLPFLTARYDDVGLSLLRLKVNRTYFIYLCPFPRSARPPGALFEKLCTTYTSGFGM